MKYIFHIVLVTTLFASCKKDNNKPCSNTLPTNITSTSGANTKYRFGAGGRLDSAISVPSSGGNPLAITAFAYSSGKITAVTESFAKITDISFYNSQGMVIKTLYTGVLGNTKQTATTTYEYNGTQVIKATKTQETLEGNTITIYTYQWKDGNMVAATKAKNADPVETTIYTYYTDKSAAAGDVIIMDELRIYGGAASVIKNKNLVKSIDDYKYAYSFDNNGKITAKATTTPSGESIIETYDYSCH